MNLQQIKNQIAEKYPGLRKAINEVQYVSGNLGDRFAEYLPADEPGAPNRPNPYKGKATLVLNPDKVKTREEAVKVIAGDLLHHLRYTDKGFQKLIKQYDSMALADPNIRKRQEARQATIAQSYQDARPLDQFMKVSGNDAVIRAYVMGYENFKGSDYFKGSYKPILNKLKNYVKGKPQKKAIGGRVVSYNY